MIAKEKAIELLNKFKPYVYCYLGSDMLSNNENENVKFIYAKICANITVDEIINLEDFSIEGREYWNDVKVQLNLLKNE